MKLKNRQIDILKIIIELYISTAQPVSSNEIKLKFLPNLSTATLRNDMAELEKLNLIEKTHISSGRVPTTQGYRFYEKNILQPTITHDIKTKLTKILAKRFCSIENTIEESVSVINETLKLPSIITTIESNEILKRIDLIPLSPTLAIILLVTSTGNVIKNTISFNEKIILKNLSICIKIFNDRLIDTPLSELLSKIKIIKPIIQEKIENYEYLMQEVIMKVFSFKKNKKTSISGTKWITSQPEFDNINNFKNMINILEDTNIWDQIEFIQGETGETKIIFGEEIGMKELSVASTIINGIDNKHQISIIGPNRMDYSKVKWLLDFLKLELEKKYNEK